MSGVAGVNEQPNIANKRPRTAMMAAITLAIKVIAAATTYVFTFVLAHTMDVADFGIVGALLSATFLLSVVGVMGQRLVLLRFVPPYLGGEDHAGMTGIINRAFQLAGAGTMALFAVVSIVTLVLGLLGHVESWPILFFGYLLIPLQGWIDMQAHLSRAYRSIVLALLPKEVLWRGITGVAVVAVFSVGGGASVELSTVVGVLVTVLGGLVVTQSLAMRRYLSTPPIAFQGKNSVPQGWRASVVPFWISSVSGIVFTNVDVVLVAVLFGGVEAGFYFAANRLAQVLTFFLMSYNIVVGPELSREYAKGQMARVQAIVSQATLHSAVPNILLGILLLIFAPYVLAIFGAEFSAAAPILQILLVAGMLNAAMGPADIVLTMCGCEREAMIASVVTVAGGIAVIAGLGWVFGPVGIAAGTLAAMVLKKLVFWAIAWKQGGIRTDLAFSVIAQFKPVAS